MPTENTATDVCHLDIAYLAIGANAALAEAEYATHERLIDGHGQLGIIDLVIEHAPTLRRLWVEIGEEWAGGCWAYEVAEEVGRACIVAMLNGEMRPDAEKLARAAIASAEGVHSSLQVAAADCPGRASTGNE